MGHLISGPLVGLMVTSSKKAYATHCMTQATAARASTLRQATADLYLYRRVKHRSGSVSVGSLGTGLHKVLFEPTESLWWVWSFIQNVILPILQPFWGFSFALGHGVSYFGWIQHYPVNGCSAVSCKFWSSRRR